MKDLPILLIAGQSNAVGCTDHIHLKQEETNGKYPRVYLYQEGNFTAESKNKIHYGVHLGMGCKPHQMGIEYGIARELNDSEKPVGLIRFAYGGTDLGFHWQTRFDHVPSSVEEKGYCYHELVGTTERGLAAYRAQGFVPQIRGLIWMQGESDTNKTLCQAQSYQKNLSELFTSLRQRLSLPQLKILVGGISTVAPTAPYSDTVREQQQLYCQKDPLAFYVDNTDLPMGSDGWHYGADDCLTLGRRFGALAKNLFLN